MIKKLFPVFIIILIPVIFFKPFFIDHLLPVPSDTIVGLYYPLRDLYAKEYPRGVPFKNFLITDPVRQQYPWRTIAVTLEKNMQFPLWNPYSFSGSPLLANFQSAVLYPLNIFLLIFPISIGWGILIFLQPVLAGIFLYLYLRKMNISLPAAVLGGLTFAFSGFSIAWLEWNTIIQTILWLPLILFIKENLLEKFSVKWAIFLIFADCSAIFAGHPQILFYTLCISNLYLCMRISQISYRKSSQFFKEFFQRYIPFVIPGVIILAITSLQLLSTFQLITLSARSEDQSMWQNPGWFIPWQHLIQFIAPDFFGNPATLNYWGVWNYGELVGYIGIVPLIMALFAMFFRRDKKTLFFGSLVFLSLFFALPTPFAKIPFLLKIPFISTSQPTRLLFVIDFSLAILAALGFDYFLQYKKRIWYPLIFVGSIFICLWLYVLSQHILVAKQNLILPTMLFVISAGVIILGRIFQNKAANMYLLTVLIVISMFDLLRFSQKFTPFTSPQYLFPNTQAISFLQKNTGVSRIMTTDSRILPPNFSIMYHLQSVDGYDPLYLRNYAELIAASERKNPNINPPFGFNRIITPHNYDSRIIDLLGVRYVLSVSDLHSSKLQKVFQEGETQIYENTNFLPRVFFVNTVHSVNTKQKAIDLLFQSNFHLFTEATIETPQENSMQNLSIGIANIQKYSENNVVIATKNPGDGFLLLTDVYYPTWHVTIDGQESKIYLTDFSLRGVFVPKGKHEVVFYDRL